MPRDRFLVSEHIHVSERDAACRKPALDRICFRWRPFHLRIILQEMNHVPFADKPAKLAYMWRDSRASGRKIRHPGSCPYALSSKAICSRKSSCARRNARRVVT
jgi:hypothetical protein